MQTMHTRDRILDAALDLFSTHGFDGVSVKQIAEAVGVKDSSLYKHFSSKQAILDTLMCEMNERFAKTVAFYRLPQGEIAAIADAYGRRDLLWLKEACKAVFLFLLSDPKASKFRRLLMIEQFKSVEAANTFRSWFIDDAIRFQTALFTEMIGRGFFRKGSPEIIAMQFYAPFYLLLSQYDAQPEKESEALSLLMRHVEQFADTYQIRNEETE